MWLSWKTAGSSAIADSRITAKSRTLSRAQLGMEAPAVIVETHLAGGLPGFTLVGLPETAVREARDRVKGALANCGYEFPVGRVVVNLAPADLLKEGGRFDLAIAISILRATDQLRGETPVAGRCEFLGELSLGGELRPVRGSLCAALNLDADQQLVVPLANSMESQAAGTRVVPLAHLQDVTAWLTGRKGLEVSGPATVAARAPESSYPEQILGQQSAKRALVLAAAGGHHLLMVGPPGTGKSLLARRLAAIMPALGERAALEVAAVYSAAGAPNTDPRRAPIRDPHHSVSATAMVGGGHHPRPGEISLAHHGVLFLDELPHFKPTVLDALREPLETREVSIVRTGWQARFPACFQLVAAMNPCPAGLVCSTQTCRCRPDQVRRYQSRVSGPLLDRIDLHVPVPEVPRTVLLGESSEAEPSAATTLARIADVRQVQLQRQQKLNSELTGTDLNRAVELDAAGRNLLGRATDRYRLSARGFHRVLRVARTVADLDAAGNVTAAHLAEALSYRSMDWSAAPDPGAG